MVHMGTVWDRAADVLRGRANILASIAALSIFLPSVVSNAVAAYGQPAPGTVPGPGAAVLGGVVALLVLIAGVWGQLALLAVATDPATTRQDAGRQATRRLGPALGIVIALAAVVVLLLLPAVVPLVRAGLDMSNPQAMAALPPATARFVGLYALVFFIVAVVVGARLLLLNAVILNERRGLDAVRRSFSLTRGMTWRIIAVVLLFIVLLFVAAAAVQTVTGLVFRLILGADALPTVAFLAATAVAVVSTAMSVVAAAFTAQLYVAIVGEERRPVDPVS